MEKNTNKDNIYWIRWFIVIPGAIVGGLFGPFVLHLLLLFIYYVNTYFPVPDKMISFGSFPSGLERFLTPLSVSVFFVWIGASIAPNKRIKTAKILLIAWFLLIIVFFTLTILDYNYMGLKLSFNKGGLSALMGIVGAFIGFYIVKTKEVK